MLNQDLFNKFNEVATKGMADKPSSETLAEKLDQLMPSIYIMIATLGALCILIIILTKFLYNPVKKMVKNRQDFIQKNIDESVIAKQKAFEYENEARTNLQESKDLAAEIVSKSKIEAEMIKHQYLDQGKKEANRIINEAKHDIEARQKSLENEVYKEIVTVATEISQKIIQNKVSEKEAEKYLKDYLGKK